MTSAERVRTVLGRLLEREGGAPAGWDAAIAHFVEFLELRNRGVNLVSRKTAGEILERQVLPSLAVLRVVPPGQPIRVLDVGSGGGFPGIPLKIVRPRVRLDLVDSTRKKCDFLKACVVELGFEDCAIHWCRIEQPGDTLRGRAPFDRVFARAVGGPDLLRRAAPGLLAPGGEAWVFAAPREGGLEWPGDGEEPVTSLARVA
ncbi:MAG: 16S rRNA (guanine(527)-N(7))-methyltransferase RsmG [Candidatus Eiseniibacteriota bacterium]